MRMLRCGLYMDFCKGYRKDCFYYIWFLLDLQLEIFLRHDV